MNIAVTDGRISQMIAAGLGAETMQPMGKALSPLEWPGIVVVVPLLALLYGGVK